VSNAGATAAGATAAGAATAAQADAGATAARASAWTMAIATEPGQVEGYGDCDAEQLHAAREECYELKDKLFFHQLSQATLPGFCKL